MIFVTVGNMDPFDRLITAIDDWAAAHSDNRVFAQIGDGHYQPAHCESVRFLTPSEYRGRFQQATIVVSHAGMGTIITALELQKPIIVMPKRATLGEQRNEHQLATVRHFHRSQQVLVADSELELGEVIDRALAANVIPDSLQPATGVAGHWPADPNLISFVRQFVS